MRRCVDAVYYDPNMCVLYLLVIKVYIKVWQFARPSIPVSIWLP